MADNSVLPVSGGGTETFANDDIAGVKYWRGKLSLGADGSATDAVGGAGAVSAAVQRMTLASDDPAVTALQLIDDWDESDRAKVNVIVGQAGITAGAGAVAANTPRVTMASDSPDVTHLNTIATAIAILDDWDETDRCKVNPIVGQAGVAAGAGAVGVTVQRMTLASDDPAVTALQTIDDWDEGDRAKVNLIVGQAGVAAGTGASSATTQRVVAASDSPEVAALGATSDAAVLSGNGSVIAQLKGVLARLSDAIIGEYETVAASQTTQALGATGAAGDYLQGVLIVPATTSPGNVQIKDGSNGAVTIFAGGASSVSNLVPFFVPLGMRSGQGAWQITTGANVSAIGVGNFT